jgi:NADH-quinone oxidoreductase subunit C
MQLMLEKILAIINPVIRQTPPTVDENASPKAILIHADDLVTVCSTLHAHEESFFDMLSCITGIDNGPEKGTMEIAYNLYSIPYNYHLMIKVKVPRDGAEVESLASIWKTANWHEREIFDLFGVVFKNHPDLRRILLPADWDGHPLRKDYKVQEYYKGIKTDY